MWPQKKRIRAKQFKLPLEEGVLNEVFNNPYVVILDEKVFQDKPGDVVVYLKYEEYLPEDSKKEDDLFD